MVKSNSSQSLYCTRFQKRNSRSYTAVGCTGSCFSDDIVIEILSRLPFESVPDMKSVCKWWHNICTSHSFCNTHFRKLPKALSGVFIQKTYYCVCCEDIVDDDFPNYAAIGQEGKNIVKKNTLDFLPEKVVVTASCNGLLICRSLFQPKKHHFQHIARENPELVIYVCNPLTKKFNALKPNLTSKERCGIGLAFNSLDPFSTSFEVVVVQVVQVLHKAKSSFTYLFKIFSSKTNKWRASKEIFHYSHRLIFKRHASVSGVLYWLTACHSILTFDLKKEEPQIIKLPDPVILFGGNYGMCLGESEGILHYISLTFNEFRVWILNRDCVKPRWQLKHFRHVSGMYKLVDSENWSGDVCSYEYAYSTPNNCIAPLAIKDDIVVMSWAGTLRLYDLKTGNVEKLSSFNCLPYCGAEPPIVLPYSMSLLPVCHN